MRPWVIGLVLGLSLVIFWHQRAGPSRKVTSTLANPSDGRGAALCSSTTLAFGQPTRRISTQGALGVLNEVFEHLMQMPTQSQPSNSAALPASNLETLIVVAGNWYDRGKAPKIGELAAQYPGCTILLAGGRAERLTSSRSLQLGGEPLELREVLLGSGQVAASQLVLWTGSRVTTHNIMIWKHFVEQVREFEPGKLFRVLVLEEAYLMRRVRATTLAVLDPLLCSGAIRQLEFIPTGARHYPELFELHNSEEGIVGLFLLGEVSRLLSYSDTSGTRRPLFTRSIAFDGLSESEFANLNELVASARSDPQLAERIRMAESLLDSRETTLQLSPKYVHQG